MDIIIFGEVTASPQIMSIGSTAKIASKIMAFDPASMTLVKLRKLRAIIKNPLALEEVTKGYSAAAAPIAAWVGAVCTCQLS